jgi:hypothetical protein
MKNRGVSLRRGKRYQLVVYQYTLERWWFPVLLLGLVLLFMWYLLSRHPLGRAESWRATAMLWVSLGVLLMAVLLIIMRKMAYVQPCDGYLRIVLPFLGMNISYKRFKRTFTAEMGGLFPPNKVKGWQREIIRPISSWTAIVIELTGYPFPRRFLEFFMSPLFFADKTTHLVILVRDWMSFSTEMDSLRIPGSQPRQRARASRIGSGLLSNLKSKKK